MAIVWPILAALLSLALPAVAQTPAESEMADAVARLHAALADGPVWTDMRRNIVHSALREREQQGLLPDAACDPAVTRDDHAMTVCVLRHVRDLRQGAVAQQVLGADWHLAGLGPPDTAELISALRHDTLAGYLAAQSPTSPLYAELTAASIRYSALASSGLPWVDIPSTGEIVLDSMDPRLPLLEQRLIVEGDLDANDTSNLRAAVRRFQSRHGLDPDGRVGLQTIAALNVTPSQRRTQIAVALERSRHEPRAFSPNRIEVNIADADMRLFVDNAVALEMRAIVGDPRHPTPVMAAKITAITFNPPWTIPASIARREIHPELRRNPHYLRENSIEILGRTDDPYGLAIDWQRLPVSSFPFQLRQDPGTKNPLGAIKFEMANADDIYLHDTPAKQLFLRTQRAFSHGCVRLEHAKDLAEHLLALSGNKQIEDGNSDETHTTPLKQPLPIYIFYRTVFADDSGRINFRPDIYGRDKAIASALRYHFDSLPVVQRGALTGCANLGGA